MEMTRKKKYLVMSFDILFFLAIFFAIILPVSFIFFKKLCRDPELGRWFSDNRLLMLILNDLIQLPIIIIVYKLIKKRSLFKAVNFSKINRKNLLVSIFIGIAAGVFTMALVHLPAVNDVLPGFKKNIYFLVRANFFIFLFSLLINPLYKELLFRGIIFEAMDKNMPTWVALLAQSVVYGLIIQGVALPIRFYAVLSALLMGILYVWGRSMWSPIIAGVCINISYYLLFKTPLKLLMASPYILPTFIITLIATIGLNGYLIISNKLESGGRCLTKGNG